MQGKTIRLFLVDGIPTGILTAEIINWTGKVIVSPRPRMPDLATRQESRRTGVYFLIGPDPEAPNRDRVYIGEADNVLTRITGHDRDDTKDFWTRTVLIISKDNNITKAHARYLESRLITMANQAGRAIISNGTAPQPPPLPEPDVADMEFFLEQVRLMLPALGFSVLQPRPNVSEPSGEGEVEPDSPLFQLEQVGIQAYAREVGDEFVVLKGSTARKQGVPSWTAYKGLREQLVSEGKLAPTENPEFYLVAEDIPVSSPSAGAAIVLARNVNGRTDWKVKGTSQSYKEWYENKISQAGGHDELGNNLE